ncbi:vWA domain-containing protein [Anaerosporobacter sp.]|uniref:vWA domain-containing protein n=1 Tax=Anaerosporobacter sp. TaxID=1872529 RepID=UPI00286F6BD2|nr:vWA domain-containing protein [Anaerosporobacter sp.]
MCNYRKTLKLISYIFCFFLLSNFFCNISFAKAKDYETTPTTTDVVFILDVSASMKKTDSERISIEIIKLMIDLYSDSNTRVGFIAYNDSIVSIYNLADMSNASLRKDLKKQINTLPFSGYTDMGLALKKGLKLFDLEKDKENQPIVILLSDGETDLSGSTSKRTDSDSYNDIKKSISLAKKSNIPIYTIGLTDNYNTNLDYLTDISSSTNAASYTATNPYQLIDILNGILSPYTDTIISPTTTYTCNKSTNSIDITPIDESTDTLNIILLQKDSPNLEDVLTSAEDTTIVRSNAYTLVKIKKPLKETIRLKFEKSSSTRSINLTTLNTYDFTPTIVLEDSIPKSQSSSFQFVFKDISTKEIVTDSDLYNSTLVEYTIKECSTGKISKLVATNEDSSCDSSSTFATIGTYEIYATYKSDFLIGTTDTFTFEVVNTPPTALSSLTETIVNQEGLQTYNLETLFTDKDNDTLSYAVEDITGASLDASITNGTLHVKGNAYGDSTVVISATDESGDSCTTTISIHCISIYTKHKTLITIAIIVCVALIAIIACFIIIKRIRKRIAMPKPEFVGHLVGYFLSTKNAEEIPPLKWNLAEYPNKALSMTRLLKDRSVELTLPDSDKIWFSPKVGSAIELIHNTRCTILVGTQVVNRNTPTILHYGDKLYIAFEDMSTEIELRFKNS